MAHWKKRETLFAEYGIRLVLPGHWQLRPSDEAGRWIYRSADRREQVTITHGELPMGGNDEETLIRRAVMRHRKAVELGFDRAHDLAMTEPEHGEWEEVPSVRYSGSADGERHCFHALLLFPERMVWAFFYETFSVPEAVAAERAGEILEKIAFGARR